MTNWKTRILWTFGFAALLVANAGSVGATAIRSSGGCEWEGDKSAVKDTPALQAIANVPIDFLRENRESQVTQFCQACAFRGTSDIPVKNAKLRVRSGYTYFLSSSRLRRDPVFSVNRYITGTGGCVSWNENAPLPTLGGGIKSAQMEVKVAWQNGRKAARTSVVCQIRWVPVPAVSD